MNKILYFSIGILAVFLGSCQESTDIIDIQTSELKNIAIDPSNKASDDILIKLQAFNDSLYNSVSTNPSINRTSGLGDRFKKYLKISIADFLGRCEGACCGITIGSLVGPEGAAIGAAILAPLVGACRSYQAAYPNEFSLEINYQHCISSYIKMKEEVSDYSQHYPSIIKLRLPADKQELQTEGAQHNIMLTNFTERTYSSTSLNDALANGTVSEEEYQILGHIRTYLLFTRLPHSEPDYHEEYIFGDKYNEIINLYKRAIKDLSFSYDDVQFISNRYVHEIYSTSELKIEQKDNLTSSIGVMVSSVEHWSVFDNEEEEQ